MQYLGTDDQGTNSFSLQDFEPSFGSKMNAAVRESWLESYGPAAVDLYKSKTGGEGEKRLSATEATDYAKSNGGGARIGITPKDGQYTQQQWSVIVDRQRELAAIKDVRERTPWDMGSILRGGAMFGAGIVDPINLATAVVPWTRMVGVARGLQAAAMAESAVTRAGARFGLGAIDGGISTAVLEPAFAYARNEIGDDYGALDSLANIAFGTAFGGGLHVIGGAAGEGLRSMRGKAQAYEPFRGLSVPDIEKVQTLQREMKDVDPRDIARAVEAFTPEMRKAAGFAPESVHAGMPEIVERAPEADPQPKAPSPTRGAIAAVPDAVFQHFPDMRPADSGLIALNMFTAQEQDALRAAGLVETKALESGEAHEGVDPEKLWPERKLRSDEEKANRPAVTDAQFNRGIEQRAKIYERLAKEQEDLGELGDMDQADAYRKKAEEIRAGKRETAAAIVATLDPETREAAMRASVAQAIDGRNIDVEAVIGMDESLQSHTVSDAEAAADRNFSPEEIATADDEAAMNVQSRVDSAPKWEALADAEAAMAEADTLLADTVKAGDQAFKYSRAVEIHEGTGLPINADGTVTIFHHTSAEAAAKIRETGVLKSTGEPDVYVTTRSQTDTGYGDTAVPIKVKPSMLEIDDEFPDGRKDFRINTGRPGGSVKVGIASDAPLYARGISPEQAPEFLTESLRQSFGASTERLLDEGGIKLVATPEEIPGGPHPGDVKAATAPDGTVYVVAQNVSEAEARGILLHEVGVHVGMERMLGSEVFQSVLGELDDAIIRGDDWAHAARAAVPADTPAGLVREEQLAYLVQNAPELPIVQRIIAAVRAWAYQNFEFARDRMTLGEADFRAMAVSALHEAARGRGVMDAALAFSRDVAQTGTKAFADWFGASKVVDAEGKPLVVYHGTANDVSAFDPKIAQSEGGAFFFSHSPLMKNTADNANQYAKSRGPLGSANVMPVYLSAKKLFEAGFTEKMPSVEKDIEPWLGRMEKFNTSLDQSKVQYYQRTIREARLGGYDGVVFRNVQDVPDNVAGRFVNEADVYAVFHPEQIKSATGNRGTFDPKNPDIRYARGETPDPSTSKDELSPFDENVARAKQFAGVLRAAADKLDNDAQATAAMRAAMPDISRQEINDLLGQLRKQVKGLRGMARTARDAVGAEDKATGMQYDAMQAADTLSNNLVMAAVIEKRNAALNINVRMKASAYVNQFRGAGLDFEGFRGLLVGTERKRAGGRISVEAEQKNFRGEWMGGLIADLEKTNLMQAFTSGTFDRDVYIALHNMGNEGKGNDKLPGEAVKIAEIVNKYQTDARNTRNRFGSWIRDLSGYITRQSHDMLKIRDAGERAWVDTVTPLLDIPKMQKLGLISETDPVGSLHFMFDDFAAGSHLKAPADEADLAVLGRGSSLAKKVSASRTLYFKDGASAFTYNEKFGQGRLAESVLHGLDSAAKSAGLMKLLGTNPEATATRLFDEYAESLRGDPARRARFLQYRGELANLLATVDGSANIPGNVTGAKIASFARSWASMSKLGGMLISSVTDLANYAAEMRFGQDKNLLSGTLQGIGALTRGRASGERRAILNSLGVFHESTLGSVFARFDSPDLMGGKTAAAMQQFFKLTGINWWTESLRDGYALSHAAFVSSQAGKAFDKIDASLRDMLGLYNIDAGKWEVLRLANTQQADGRMYITPEGLRTVPVKALEAYITSVGRTVSDAAVMNLQDDLASALRTMTIDRMHHAVIEPGARTQAFMRRGTKPGTVNGELLRFVGQFKSFPVALIQMTLGREVYGRGYDTIGDYLKRGKGDMLGLASFVALSTAMGYAAMATKDLLRGKNPRPVDDYRTWMAAMVQGGGLGLYGDFLFGKYNRMGNTLSGSMLGPVANTVDTAADLWTRIRNGDDVAAASFKAALDNTPFANLFYTRTALDYLILYRIQDALNPGFLRRMENRVKSENGQTFYLPPSQVAR